MARKAWLSERHKRRATQIAREKGLSCPDCGSPKPVPEDEVKVHSGGGADIAMRCVNCESASELTLFLCPEEAQALGLHALRDRPEAP